MIIKRKKEVFKASNVDKIRIEILGQKSRILVRPPSGRNAEFKC